MNWYTRLRLTISDFVKKYRRIIFIVIVVWAIIIGINIYLRNRVIEKTPITTYTPDDPIVDIADDVPEKMKKPIHNKIDEYISACNDKDYDRAFAMLTNDCKNRVYKDDINLFKQYIDWIFNNKKIYNIQNYSNVGKVYIYNVKILDDIMASGTSDKYDYYLERLALIEQNGEIKISNQQYILAENKNIIVEDDVLKITISIIDHTYEYENYTVEIVNKTSNYVAIADNKLGNEITLNLNGEKRNLTNIDRPIVINPNGTMITSLNFVKFFDDSKVSQEINFNSVRLLSYYSTDMTVEDQEKNASRLYSININLR